MSRQVKVRLSRMVDDDDVGRWVWARLRRLLRCAAAERKLAAQDKEGKLSKCCKQG